MKRNTSLDAIKGLLIVLVILGHSLQYGFGYQYEVNGCFYDDYLFRAIYGFHIPLFMLISGYLFWYSNHKPFVSMLISKLRYIGIPFFVYSSILYFVWWNMVDFDAFYWSDYLRKMHIHLWFLSSLLLNCLIVGCITHLVKDVFQIPMIALVCIGSLFIPDDIITSMHKFVLFYFVLGYFVNSIHIEKARVIIAPLFFLCLSVCYVGCIMVYDKDLMMYEGGFCIWNHGCFLVAQLWKDFIRFMICTISICWFLNMFYHVVIKNRVVINILALIGKHTLPIYGLQSLLYMLINLFAEKNDYSIPHNYLSPLILCMFCLGLCWILILVFSKWRFGRILFIGSK